jgi:hypothetical protein
MMPLLHGITQLRRIILPRTPVNKRLTERRLQEAA